jgi:hypothetical protein
MSKNIYLELMDDEEPKSKAAPRAQPKQPVVESDASAPRIAPAWATVSGNQPVPAEAGPASSEPSADKNVNPYLALLEDDEQGTQQPNLGSILGATGASLGSSIARNAEGIAESAANAPTGSVAEIKALLNPSKVKMTPAMAAQAAAEARVPTVAPVSALPVEKPLPSSGGAKWLENYANIQDPEFSGGVPEAAQKYQSTKPQGKVTGKNFKRFGNRPLNIAGQAAQTVISEDEQLMRVRQALYEREMHKRAVEQANRAEIERVAQVEREAQAATNASRASKALLTVGKGLGAVGAGMGAYDAYKRFYDGDKYGAAVGGLGTVAGLAPMVMGSAGMLPALGAAAPLMLMAHDRIEYLKKHPEEIRLQEDNFDPLGMPIR